MAWPTDPAYRDIVSIIVGTLALAIVGTTVRMLHDWPRDTWVRQFGLWATGALAGCIAGALCASWLLPHYFGAFIAVVFSASWLGNRIIDRLAKRAIKIIDKEANE